MGGRIAQVLAYLLPGPAAPGLIPSIPKKIQRKNYRCCWAWPTMLVRVKWTVAWKCWSHASSTDVSHCRKKIFKVPFVSAALIVTFFFTVQELRQELLPDIGHEEASAAQSLRMIFLKLAPPSLFFVKIKKLSSSCQNCFYIFFLLLYWLRRLHRGQRSWLAFQRYEFDSLWLITGKMERRLGLAFL